MGLLWIILLGLGVWVAFQTTGGSRVLRSREIQLGRYLEEFQRSTLRIGELVVDEPAHTADLCDEIEGPLRRRGGAGSFLRVQR